MLGGLVAITAGTATVAPWAAVVIGVAAGVIIVFGRIWRLPLLHIGDGTAQALSLLLVVKRLGCFLAGCCYGTPTGLPWSVHYPAHHAAHGIGVHPVQLYEALIAMGMFLVLLKAERRQPRPGFVTALFMILYGAARFGLEYFRAVQFIPADPLPWTASQLISVALVLAGAGLIGLLMRSRASAGNPASTPRHR